MTETPTFDNPPMSDSTRHSVLAFFKHLDELAFYDPTEHGTYDEYKTMLLDDLVDSTAGGIDPQEAEFAQWLAAHLEALDEHAPVPDRGNDLWLETADRMYLHHCAIALGQMGDDDETEPPAVIWIGGAPS